LSHFFQNSERPVQRDTSPPEDKLVEEIRARIISEAKAYLKKHKIDETKLICRDEPRQANHDIYVGSNGHKSGDWFNIDDCFNSEVY
jgi:hypothetical protein